LSLALFLCYSSTTKKEHKAQFKMQQQQQQQPPAVQQAYTFTQAPQAIPARSKYRDPFARTEAANIMWDKRVYRGNTYAAQILPQSALAEIEIRKRREKALKKKEEGRGKKT
jgi:hypothetical protein